MARTAALRSPTTAALTARRDWLRLARAGRAWRSPGAAQLSEWGGYNEKSMVESARDWAGGDAGAGRARGRAGGRRRHGQRRFKDDGHEQRRQDHRRRNTRPACHGEVRAPWTRIGDGHVTVVEMDACARQDGEAVTKSAKGWDTAYDVQATRSRRWTPTATATLTRRGARRPAPRSSSTRLDANKNGFAEQGRARQAKLTRNARTTAVSRRP